METKIEKANVVSEAHGPMVLYCRSCGFSEFRERDWRMLEAALKGETEYHCPNSLCPTREDTDR